MKAVCSCREAGGPILDSALTLRRGHVGPGHSTPMRSLEIRRLGTIPYSEGLEVQQELVAARRADRISDVLLLMQHPHVITLGVNTRRRRDHVLAAPDALAERGVGLFETERGGDVTYHGPGQLVGYPIMNLGPDRCDVHRYVRDLEEVMIRTAAGFGITASRVAGLTGVWVGRDKIGAIGVRISRWITSHGFAFNVSTDLDYFKLILPCGIANRGVTSLARLLGRPAAPATMEAVEDVVVEQFAAVFERQVGDGSGHA